MLSLALSRGDKWSMLVLRRSLSALPKRHSRHGPPPTCVSGAQLMELTEELLESKPGSLYTFKPSENESTRAWEVADPVVQKTEFLVRGHAAHIPDTVWHKVFSNQLVDKEDVSSNDRIEMMKTLVERLDREGELYMKLRKEVRSQLALESTTIATEKDEESEQEEVENEESVQEHTLPVFASPGPTVAMFDTLLDSMAVATHDGTPKAVGSVLEKVLERYEQDGGSENINIHTVPTAMTYNGVLRAIANTDSTKERTRDDALYYAFGTYDAMREVIPRNSATYTYMLQTVTKYLPPSRTRGNIAHGLWTQARKENVVDDMVIKALQGAHKPSNGPEFEVWMKRFMEDRNNEVLPKFKRNAKVRRHDKRFATY